MRNQLRCIAVQASSYFWASKREERLESLLFGSMRRLPQRCQTGEHARHVAEQLTTRFRQRRRDLRQFLFGTAFLQMKIMKITQTLKRLKHNVSLGLAETRLAG